MLFRSPLARNGVLGIANGIEYAAQAMAVHGAVRAQHAPGRSGYLASVRDVQWFTPTLHDVAEPLEIKAERLSGSDNNVLYAFSLSAGGRLLLQGRSTVILNADNL